MRFGLLTVSDTCFKNPSEDLSGPELKRCLKEHTKFADSTIVSGIVPDEVVAITKWLTDNIEFCDVILTTGGTGFSARDVTPEATRAVIQRPCPGIVVALLKAGLDQTPMAALSRQEAGIAGQCLIVNLPGSPKACREGIPVLAPILPHAVALLREDKKEVQKEHAFINT